MIGRLFSAVGIVAVATLLAGGGFIGYLVGTGRLTAARLERMAAVLRGELDGPADAGGVADPPGTEAAEPRRATSAEEVRALRQREHLEKLEIERALADLEAQRRLLDQAMHAVVQEQERLAAERSGFDVQRTKLTDAALDEGFRKELEYVSGLAPRQAKEHILRVWQRQKADAVRLFMEIDVSRGRRILEQFRTPEELDIQTELLEQIRLQGMAGYADASGKTEGDAAQ